MTVSRVKTSMKLCPAFFAFSIGLGVYALPGLATPVAAAQVAVEGSSSARLVDRVVAVVNEDIILRTELMMRVAPIAFELNNISDPNERARRQEKLNAQILDEMINESLVSQAARAAKLEISAKEVDAAIRDLKKQNNLDDEQLAEALKMQGLTMSAYRKDVRDQILRLRAVNTLVRSRVSINDDDVRAQYETNARRSGQVSEVRLQHILIAVPATASEDDQKAARAEAAEVVEKMRQGGDFATLAQAHSDDPATRNTGGDLGWIERGTIATEWEVVVFAMQKGETRGPINGPRGLHVFHVGDVKDAKQEPYEEAKERIRNELYKIELDKETRKWVEELRKKAHYEVKL